VFLKYVSNVKQVVVTVDKHLFKGRIAALYFHLLDRRLHRKVRSRYGFSFGITYNRELPAMLNGLCDTYGSDKGYIIDDSQPYIWPSHTYADFYALFFHHRRDFLKIIECGIGTNNPTLKSSMGETGKPGASLRVWRDYFPNAEIIGIDIDEVILFNEDRIRTYQCDQTSRASIRTFIERAEITEASINLVIDDGLHEFNAGVTLFEELITSLADDGIYIIEDVAPSDLLNYMKYFDTKSNLFNVYFVDLHRPSVGVHDNRLVIISKIS